MVSDKGSSSLFTSSWLLCTFHRECHQSDTRFKNISCGKSNKCIFAYCAVGDAGEKQTVDSILNLQDLVQAMRLRYPTQGYCGPLIFLHSPVISLKLGVAPGGGCHMVYFENHWYTQHFKYKTIQKTQYRIILLCDLMQYFGCVLQLC